jgi:hypothetical protein
VDKLHAHCATKGLDDLRGLILAQQAVKYHLSICERQDLIGATHHSLDILRKE